MSRRLADRLFVTLAWAAGLCVFALLLSVVYAIGARGVGALSWEFFAQPVREAGGAGGVRDQILGTLILVATAASVAWPLATGLALAAGHVLRSERARRHLRATLQLWNGVPSIVIGLTGMLLFVQALGWGKSWLAGGLLLGWMIVPTVAVARVERIDAIAPAALDAAAALGFSARQVVTRVVLPQSRSGLLTGLLLGLSRASGETAPILFTAAVFAGASWPDGVRDNPVLALPYHIWVLAQDSLDPAAGEKLWGAAAVLLLMALGLSALALPLRLRSHEEARRV